MYDSFNLIEIPLDDSVELRLNAVISVTPLTAAIIWTSRLASAQTAFINLIGHRQSGNVQRCTIQQKRRQTDRHDRQMQLNENYMILLQS